MTATGSPSATATAGVARTGIGVYPNPASAGIVRFFYPPGAAATVVVYNAAGYRVAKLSDPNGQGEILWDVARVAPGIYAFRVVFSGQPASVPVTLLLR